MDYREFGYLRSLLKTVAIQTLLYLKHINGTLSGRKKHDGKTLFEGGIRGTVKENSFMSLEDVNQAMRQSFRKHTQRDLRQSLQLHDEPLFNRCNLLM